MKGFRFSAYAFLKEKKVDIFYNTILPEYWLGIGLGCALALGCDPGEEVLIAI